MAIKKVLIVDDDKLVLNALRRSMRGEGYLIETADSSQEAFEKLRQDAYDVVVSDFKMPRIDGLSLLRWVADNQAHVRRILLTGHADLGVALTAVNEVGVYRIVQKPWDDAELRVIVQMALRDDTAPAPQPVGEV